MTDQPPQTPAPMHQVRRLRRRLLWLSLLICVVLPSSIAALYLFFWAADQYDSNTAFSVRRTDNSSSFSTLAAFAGFSDSSVPDSVVLYDYIQSQAMMEAVSKDLDLDKIYNRHPSDFVYSMGHGEPVEDRLDYWNSMVTVSLDTTTNILYLRVLSFDPKDSVTITKDIIARCTAMVNDLSAQAQRDATKSAEEDLNIAQSGLKTLRVTIQSFRDQNRIIDPSANVQTQNGVIGALQGQLAEALVAKAQITPAPNASGTDPRIELVDRRIAAIRQQIDQEQARVAKDSDGALPLSTVMGKYEALTVDLNFAQQAYTAAMAEVQQAKAEARRRSRYLAVHVPPSMAQDSEYPQRALISVLILLGSFAAWAVAVLIYYNIRERR